MCSSCSTVVSTAGSLYLNYISSLSTNSASPSPLGIHPVCFGLANDSDGFYEFYTQFRFSNVVNICSSCIILSLVIHAYAFMDYKG